MTNKIQPISFFNQVPQEVFEIVLKFCKRKELFNLLTVCSKFFPIVAKRLWSKQYIDFYTRRNVDELKDYRFELFFKEKCVSKGLSTAPSLPYLNYVTKLELSRDLYPKNQSLILTHVPNCKILITTWSKDLASDLLNTTTVVPFLTYLEIYSQYDPYDTEEPTQGLQAILNARAETLKSLHLGLISFCISQLLFTVVSNTKLIEFDHFRNIFICHDECSILSNHLISKSSCLRSLSFIFSPLYTPLELNFFDWIHSSPNLTTFNLTLDPHEPGSSSDDFAKHFLHFLKTFPTSTPLKKLDVWYVSEIHSDELSDLIRQAPTVLNSSLVLLQFKFDMTLKRISYTLLNFMLEKFAHLRCLKVFGHSFPSNADTVYNKGSLDEHQSFLNRLTSLHLVKLVIDIPNSIQHFLLPHLKCMTMLKELELRLNLDLVYQFITELTHINCFIWRPTKQVRDLKILIDLKPIPLIRRENARNQMFYIFNQQQLALIRNTPFDSIRFESLSDQPTDSL